MAERIDLKHALLNVVRLKAPHEDEPCLEERMFRKSASQDIDKANRSLAPRSVDFAGFARVTVNPSPRDEKGNILNHLAGVHDSIQVTVQVAVGDFPARAAAISTWPTPP